MTVVAASHHHQQDSPGATGTGHYSETCGSSAGRRRGPSRTGTNAPSGRNSIEPNWQTANNVNGSQGATGGGGGGGGGMTARAFRQQYQQQMHHPPVHDPSVLKLPQISLVNEFCTVNRSPNNVASTASRQNHGQQSQHDVFPPASRHGKPRSAVGGRSGPGVSLMLPPLHQPGGGGGGKQGTNLNRNIVQQKQTSPAPPPHIPQHHYHQQLQQHQQLYQQQQNQQQNRPRT
ncbi:hypothetical protein HKX48_004995, partial [Thoreauomyces humboldtii]